METVVFRGKEVGFSVTEPKTSALLRGSGEFIASLGSFEKAISLFRGDTLMLLCFLVNEVQQLEDLDRRRFGKFSLARMLKSHASVVGPTTPL